MEERLSARVAEVRERIEAACRAAGREPGSVRLVAVSKGHPVESVLAAAACGLNEFGENYLQELAAKAPALPGAAWHYQGTVQRRKIREILGHASSFLSVARPEEFVEIEKRAAGTIECHVEVNVGREPRKNGVLPESLPAILETAARCERVRIAGLMTVPPDDDDPARWFAALRKLGEAHGLSGLSMGMSGDFETAIREGSTMVRIGTAIFGERPAR